MGDEVVFDVAVVKEYACDIDAEGQPESGAVAKVLREDTAEDDAEAHADVPTDELGGVGCSAFRVGCEVDEHGLHAGPDMSVAKTDDERCTIVADWILEGSKEEIAEETHDDAVVDILHHPPFTERAGTNETREDESSAKHCKPSTCARRHPQDLFAVDGEVGGKDAVAHADADHNDSLAPSLDEEETVPGNRVAVGDNLFRRELDGGIDEKADACRHQAAEKEHVVIRCILIDKQSDGRSNAGGEVVAESVIADTLCPTRRMKDVDGTGRIGHRHGPHRSAVHRADDGKECHRARNQVAGKHRKEEEIADQQHGAAGEAVNQIARKRARQQRRQRIAGEDKSDGVFVGLISLAEVERQQGGDEHEREKNHEIG